MQNAPRMHCSKEKKEKGQNGSSISIFNFRANVNVNETEQRSWSRSTIESQIDTERDDISEFVCFMTFRFWLIDFCGSFPELSLRIYCRLYFYKWIFLTPTVSAPTDRVYFCVFLFGFRFFCRDFLSFSDFTIFYFARCGVFLPFIFVTLDTSLPAYA